MNLLTRVDKLERQAGGERLTVARQPFSKLSLPETTTSHSSTSQDFVLMCKQ